MKMTILFALLILAGCSARATLPEEPAKFGPASSQRAIDSEEALTGPGQGLPN